MKSTNFNVLSSSLDIDWFAHSTILFNVSLSTILIIKLFKKFVPKFLVVEMVSRLIYKGFNVVSFPSYLLLLATFNFDDVF